MEKKMSNRKTYRRPQLTMTKVQLGVFGEYGSVSGGETNPNHPVKITNPFDFTIE